jgi:steroid delta-isomerase-like uncharacterized protein
MHERRRRIVTFDENKALARRALDEIWTQGRLDAIGDVYGPNFVSHQDSHPTGPRSVKGLDALKEFVQEFHDAFADFRDTVDDQIAEGDRVVTRFTSAGTHTGELMGIAPTGRSVEWMGIEIARIQNGRIAENWVSWDMAGMLRQLSASSPG